MGKKHTSNKVIVETILATGMSHKDAAALFNVSTRWIRELIHRYRTGGYQALEPRSRRPHSNPRQVPESTVGPDPRRVYFPGVRPIPIGTDNRLRRDKVDNDGKVTLRWAGTMRKLYVGRKHRTKEIMLICINNDITAINPHTGEIWGRYHLDKTKKYHRNQLGEI